MARDSCIQHRPHTRLAIIRDDYLELTGDTVSAALLNYFEYRANASLAPEAEPENLATVDIGKVSVHELEISLLKLSTDKQIRQRLIYLVEVKLISTEGKKGITPSIKVHIRAIQEALTGATSIKKYATPVKQPRSGNPGQMTAPPRSNDRTPIYKDLEDLEEERRSLEETPPTPQGGNAIAPSANSRKSRAPEPEPAKTPSTVNGQGKASLSAAKPGARQKSSAAARARRKAAADQSPEEFQKLWDDYRQFVIGVRSSVAGNYTKWEAIAQWDALLKEGDTAADVMEGTAWYIQCKQGEFGRKGEAMGVAHLNRYLRDRKWEAALEHKRSVGGVLPVVAVATPKTKGQQISENNSQILDDWLASDDADQSGFSTVEVQAYA